MNCVEIEQLIYLVREGELTEQEKARVAEHLAVCEYCRQLSGSVNAMADLTSSLVYENRQIDDSESLIRLVRQNMHKENNFVFLIVLKRMAAALLFIMISVFVYQEYNFYRSREALRTRLQDSSGFKAIDSGKSDCVERMKRKIRTGTMASFFVPESRLYKKISEEELTQFIRQMCESGGADAGALQKLLIRTGLIDKNSTDTKNN